MYPYRALKSVNKEQWNSYRRYVTFFREPVCGEKNYKETFCFLYHGNCPPILFSGLSIFLILYRFCLLSKY
nr:MAG TPA_asm: hypothetical protein [Caudoviricetes sp.]